MAEAGADAVAESSIPSMDEMLDGPRDRKAAKTAEAKELILGLKLSVMIRFNVHANLAISLSSIPAKLIRL